MAEKKSSCTFDQHRYYMNPKTYVTKRDGQLFIVRETQNEKPKPGFEFGLNSINDAFNAQCESGSDSSGDIAVEIFDESSDSGGSENEVTKLTVQTENKKKVLPTAQAKTTCAKSTTPPNSANPYSVTQEVTIVVPSAVSSTMTDSKEAPAKPPKVLDPPPPPGIYRKGNRELALLPLSEAPPVMHVPQHQPFRNCHNSHAHSSQLAPPGYFINNYGLMQALPHGTHIPHPQQQHSHSQHMQYQQQHQCPPQVSADAMAFTPLAHQRRVVTNGIDATSSVEKATASDAKKTDRPPIPKCAGCGRERSRRFQHNNPVKKGESPPPSFCRKCQKQDTSDSESDVRIKIKTSAGASSERKVTKECNQKHDESSSCSGSEHEVIRTVHQTEDDYVILDSSEDDHRRRRSRVRIRYVDNPEPSRKPTAASRNDNIITKVIHHIRPKEGYRLERDREGTTTVKHLSHEKVQHMPPPTASKHATKSTKTEEAQSTRSELLSDDEEYRARGRCEVPQHVYKYVKACRREVGFEDDCDHYHAQDVKSTAKHSSLCHTGTGTGAREYRESHKSASASQPHGAMSGHGDDVSTSEDLPFRVQCLQPVDDDERIVITERRVYRQRPADAPTTSTSGERVQDKQEKEQVCRAIHQKRIQEKQTKGGYVEHGKRYIRKVRSTEKFYEDGAPSIRSSRWSEKSHRGRAPSNSSEDSREPVHVRHTVHKTGYVNGDETIAQSSHAKHKVTHVRETSNHRQPSVREATATEDEESLQRQQLTKSPPRRQVYQVYSRESSVERNLTPRDRDNDALMTPAILAAKMSKPPSDDDRMDRASEKTYEIERDFSPPGLDRLRRVKFRSEDSFAPTIWETESGRSYYGGEGGSWLR